MLRKIVESALTQRAFVLLCALLIAAAGAYAFLRIPIDAFPDISSVQVKITIKAPGMTPEEGRSAVSVRVRSVIIPKSASSRRRPTYSRSSIPASIAVGTSC
jgi:cobalt-zinc-cadmium resistance protein CzcA